MSKPFRRFHISILFRLLVTVGLTTTAVAVAQTAEDSPFAAQVAPGGLEEFLADFDPLAYGEREYRQSCAGCHGEEGLGDGPVGGKITPAPSDLQRIAERAGGRFPLYRIYQAIDGRDDVKAHGSPDMPIWGSRFNAEAAHQLAPDASRAVLEMLAATRVMSLVFFLESIQATPDASD